MAADAEAAVRRYVRATLSGDPEAIRACLADTVHLDWGATVYDDPDAFATACDRGITWEGFRLLELIVDGARAAVVYEATNLTDGVRVRTAEVLGLEDGRVAEGVVTSTKVPLR